MGPACKIILNDGVGGLSKSLERVLMSPLVRDVMYPASECDKLIERLAKIDLAAYDPHANEMPAGGLSGILLELETGGVFTSEIWQFFKRPDTLDAV